MPEELTYEQQYEQSVNDPFDYARAMEEYKVGKKPLLDAIMSNYKKPEPQITPEQEKRAKFGAALTDTFGSLAEMFAHGQGALVRNRETPSNTETTNARLQAIKDKYENDMLQYGATKSNAELQDLNMYLANRREAAGAKRNYAAYKAKKEYDAAQAEADRKLKEQLAKEAAGQKDKEFKEGQRQFDKKNALDWYNATKDKKEEKKTVPVFINGKQENLPSEYINKVVGNAIREGKAGTIKQTKKDARGKEVTVDEKITSTTKLTQEQTMQIFEQAYPQYIKEKLPDGRFVIMQSSSWKKPKTQVQNSPQSKVPQTSTGSLY